MGRNAGICVFKHVMCCFFCVGGISNGEQPDTANATRYRLALMLGGAVIQHISSGLGSAARAWSAMVARPPQPANAPARLVSSAPGRVST